MFLAVFFCISLFFVVALWWILGMLYILERQWMGGEVALRLSLILIDLSGLLLIRLKSYFVDFKWFLDIFLSVGCVVWVYGVLVGLSPSSKLMYTAGYSVCLLPTMSLICVFSVCRSPLTFYSRWYMTLFWAYRSSRNVSCFSYIMSESFFSCMILSTNCFCLATNAFLSIKSLSNAIIINFCLLFR